MIYRNDLSLLFSSLYYGESLSSSIPFRGESRLTRSLKPTGMSTISCFHSGYPRMDASPAFVSPSPYQE